MTDENIGETIVVQTIFGEVLAFRDDFITDQLLEYGAHTRCELAFLSHFVDPGDTVIDLGAHIGTFTLPLARKVGKAGRVVAVEADPRNYALLVENVRRAGLGEIVRTLCAVVGKPSEAYQLVRNPANTGMSVPIPTDPRNEATRGIRLSEIAKAEREVHLVKVVVQGMELEVLRDQEDVLDSGPLLYVQVHDETLRARGTTPELLGNFLLKANYRLFVNVGERNAAHDRFEIEELASLANVGPYINVLAIPTGNARLSRTGLT